MKYLLAEDPGYILDFNKIKEGTNNLSKNRGKINPFDENLTLGEIFSALLPYTFYLAGLIFFILLIWGGFGFLTSGGNPDKTKAAQGKLTTAAIGFIIIFASFWLIQIVEIVFGISILK